MTAATQRHTIVAVFPDRAQAQAAIRELKGMGFRDDQIGVTSKEPAAQTAEDADDEDATYAGEGAVAGLAAGAGVGALWGLGIVSGVMPVIGPAIAGGVLASILSSAAAGAAVAGLAGTLIGMGIPKDEAEYYESEFQAGRTIVTVTHGNRYADVLAVLRRHGGYERSGAPASGAVTSSTATSSTTDNMAGRQPMRATPTHSALHTSGTSADACASGASGPSRPATAASGSGQTIQAREEELHVDKRRQQAGDVRIRKEVHTEHKTIDVPVEREEVVIERHAVHGKPAASGPIGAGQEIRVPVTEEHVEVTKTPVVKEEVTVSKKKVTGTQQVSADLRKEELKVDKQGAPNVREKRT